jgi:hypothetical protein
MEASNEDQTTKRFLKHFTFDYEYRQFGILVAKVRVSIIDLPNGDDFVLLRNTEKGKPVSKVSEQVASGIRDRLGLDPQNTQWGENYLEYGKRIDIVTYTWNRTTKKYSSPKWYAAPEWMNEYVFKILETPVTLFPN